MNNPPNYIIPSWPAPPSIQAFTTTRLIEGYSIKPHHHFNLSNSVGDDPDAVFRNRQKLIEDLNLTKEPQWLKQIHSNHVVQIDRYQSTPIADACFTQQSKQVCVILTADCLPILICNRAGTEVAAIHAGWRGLLSGVVNNTIIALKSQARDCYAWLGPAIGPNVFELNEEIRLDFIKSHPHNGDCFYQRGKSWFADIYQLASVHLNLCGLDTIFGGEFCTYQDAHQFYSHRRDQGVTGRMASLIWIEK